MLATLKFKQGLADAVLDARGETAAFEQENARGAFMARLAEVMDTAFRVPVSGIEKRATDIPADQRLSALLQADNPGVGLCLARYGSETGQVEAVLAVGRPEATGALRGQVEKTHGVTLPPDRVVVVTPETQVLLLRLAELGFITIRQDAAKRIFDTGTSEPPPPPEHARRCRRAQEALDKAQRRVRMAGVLAGGGFAEEAIAAAREAVCQAAGALFLFAPGADVEQALEPLTDSMVAAIQSDATVERKQVATLQAAHLGLDAEPGAFVEDARAFADTCGKRLDRQRMRGQ